MCETNTAKKGEVSKSTKLYMMLSGLRVYYRYFFSIFLVLTYTFYVQKLLRNNLFLTQHILCTKQRAYKKKNKQKKNVKRNSTFSAPSTHKIMEYLNTIT